MSMNAASSTETSTTAAARPLTPLKAIRLKCLDCSGDSADEVRKCVIPHCPLYPFRLGRNPFRKPPTEKQMEASRANLLKLHETQKTK